MSYNYKGTPISSLIRGGGSNPTNLYSGFPATTQRATNYDNLRTNLLYTESNVDIANKCSSVVQFYDATVTADQNTKTTGAAGEAPFTFTNNNNNSINIPSYFNKMSAVLFGSGGGGGGGAGDCNGNNSNQNGSAGGAGGIIRIDDVDLNNYGRSYRIQAGGGGAGQRGNYKNTPADATGGGTTYLYNNANFHGAACNGGNRGIRYSGSTPGTAGTFSGVNNVIITLPNAYTLPGNAAVQLGAGAFLLGGNGPDNNDINPYTFNYYFTGGNVANITNNASGYPPPPSIQNDAYINNAGNTSKYNYQFVAGAFCGGGGAGGFGNGGRRGGDGAPGAPGRVILYLYH